MAGGEEITVPLKVDPAFFDEMDRRFDQLAQRASQKFAQAMRGAPGAGGPGGGSGGASGEKPGGGSEVAGTSGPKDYDSMGKRYGRFRDAGEAEAGAGASAAAKIFQGAGEGFLNTRGDSAQSPKVLADNAIMGAYGAGVGLLKTGAQGLGGLAGGALGGPAGAMVGQAVGGAIGDFVQSQFNSVKDSMEIPKERGIARLKSIYGQMAASGVETTAAERQQTIDFTQAIEQKRYKGEQQLEVQYRESHPTSLAFGISWAGG